MQDAGYEDYLKEQSCEELLSIKNSLSRVAYPDRFAMITAEIAGREELTLPPPLLGSSMDST